ncbi:uncharacterized protein CTRU02_201184 [Colletotrichum truncatum]|uniref:Integral membrane protein n=1 Tax=Colletotrichum truncatum TaxID=5467 RepID=A0ACC3ZGM3_COLTU|nr:uncharacterized protein CTRU02_07970 [Colletotrichum truncatum]KAF6790450.1 integral membrane protein [Colletotrichum truncatum]
MPPTGTGALSLALVLRSDLNVAAAAATAETNTTLPPWLARTNPDPSEWNGASVIAAAAISATLATTFVGLRFYTRARILRSLMWDDWFILASLFFAIATCGGMIVQLNYGLGEHLRYVWSTFPLYVKTGTFTNLLYSCSLALTKISILLLYIRILTYELVRLLGKILLGVVILSHTWIIVSILTTCIPLSAAWDTNPTSPPPYCHPFSVFWGNACLHLATDFLIFLLPLPVISSMRLPMRQKLGLYFVFCFAFLVCAISIVRLVRLFHTDETEEQLLDVTWSAVRIANLTVIEVNAAIVAACLTTLKPLACHIFPSLKPTAGASSSSSASFTIAAAEDRRRKDFEENFSTGEDRGYQRPLTIGTKRDRPRMWRDTFASLVGDVKMGSTEHLEAPTPTSATQLAEKTGGGSVGVSEFRLPEVQPPSPFGRFSSWTRGSRLQVPMHLRTPSSMTTTTTTRHERYGSVDRHGSRVPGRQIL